jgi:hypothetical protein
MGGEDPSLGRAVQLNRKWLRGLFETGEQLRVACAHRVIDRHPGEHREETCVAAGGRASARFAVAGGGHLIPACHDFGIPECGPRICWR